MPGGQTDAGFTIHIGAGPDSGGVAAPLFIIK